MDDERMEAVEEQEESFVTDFGQALDHVKNGGKAVRVGWNLKGMWIRMVVP